MPRFVCDDHCGRLARWLRTCGYDTVHDQEISDAELLGIALAENRIILTRDCGLARQVLARQVIRLVSPDPIVQLREIVICLGLHIEERRLFTRCSMCNVVTEPVTAESVAGQVPPHVQKTQTLFRMCRICGRVFWRGTHVKHMTECLRVAGLLET